MSIQSPRRPCPTRCGQSLLSLRRLVDPCLYTSDPPIPPCAGQNNALDVRLSAFKAVQVPSLMNNLHCHSSNVYTRACVTCSTPRNKYDKQFLERHRGAREATAIYTASNSLFRPSTLQLYLPLRDSASTRFSRLSTSSSSLASCQTQ